MQGTTLVVCRIRDVFSFLNPVLISPRAGEVGGSPVCRFPHELPGSAWLEAFAVSPSFFPSPLKPCGPRPDEGLLLP